MISYSHEYVSVRTQLRQPGRHDVATTSAVVRFQCFVFITKYRVRLQPEMADVACRRQSPIQLPIKLKVDCKWRSNPVAGKTFIVYINHALAYLLMRCFTRGNR